MRRARGGAADGFGLAEYVNDRPYAASSLLAVALGRVFSSARRGVSKERPDLVDADLPLEAAARRLHLDAMPERRRARLTLCRAP